MKQQNLSPLALAILRELRHDHGGKATPDALMDGDESRRAALTELWQNWLINTRETDVVNVEVTEIGRALAHDAGD